MAHTKVTKTGTQDNGTANTFSYSGSFDVFKASEVEAELNNIKLTFTTGTINESASPREYTVDYGNKTVHVGGANLTSSDNVVIQPVTDMGAPTPRATYEPGASITSTDLNNNQLQLMRKVMEYEQQLMSSRGATMTGNLHLGQNVDLTFEGDTDNSYETTLTVADPTADRTITLPNTTGTVVTTGDTGTIDATMLAANSVDSSELVDGSIDTSHIGDSQVTTAKLGSSAVTTAKLATDAVTTAKITDANVTTAKIADDAVTADKLANTSVTAGSYTATDLTVDAQGRIIAASNGTIAGSEIAADAIDGTHILDDSIDSEHYVDGSIDTAHIADNQITTAKIVDSNITTAKIADNNVTTAKIAGANVTDAKLASNSVTTSKITDGNVTTVKIADSGITLAKLTGDLRQPTISNSNTEIPTSGAVVSYVAAQLAPIGGLEVIADEVSFPDSQPSAGVVISISDAAGVVVNGSGTSTTGRTLSNSTVTINNFPTSLDNETLASGVGLMVSSTGSSQTYNYHKILAAETDVKQLSDDINDFNARYRVGSSNPSSALDSGDLFFNTGTGKLLVYNGTNSAWEEAQSIGNYYINTISSYSGTGGNSASFDGSAYRFVLSNAGTTAEQHIVSVNGVIQKPNSGTSQPGEGFAIDGSSIIFSSAPATGSDFFIITIGSTVNIGTPSDNTVTTAKLTSGAVTTVKIADDAVTAAKLASDSVVSASIVDGSIVNADVNASAAIAGTKISPDFGSQNIVTTGNCGIGTTNPQNPLTVAGNGDTAIDIVADLDNNGANNWPILNFRRNSVSGTPAARIYQKENDNAFVFDNNGSERLRIGSTGNVGIGTSSPTNQLHVYDSAAANDTPEIKIESYRPAIRFKDRSSSSVSAEIVGDDSLKFSVSTPVDDSTALTQRMRIDSDGRVAISSTGTYFDTNTMLEVVGKTGAGPNLVLHRNDTTVSNNQVLAAIRVTGNDNDGSTQQEAAAIEFAADGDHANDDKPGRIVFKTTADGGSSSSERMLIDSSGAVRIAHTSFTADTGADDLVVGSDNSGINRGITILNHTGSDGRLCFGQSGDPDAGMIKYSHGSDLMQFFVESTERMRIHNGAYVSFGTTATNPTSGGSVLEGLYGHLILSRSGTGSETMIRLNRDGSTRGSIVVSTSTTYNTSSDYRLKENVTNLTDALTRLKKVTPRRFNFIDDKDNQLVDGFIAHEVSAAVPEAVTGTKDQVELADDNEKGIKKGDPIYQQLDYSKFVPLLTAALQEAITKIETLETKVAALEAA